MRRSELTAQSRKLQSERLLASREEKRQSGIIRIGTRNPETGDYQAILPNGRVETGRKLFKAAHLPGSIVQGIPRNTGGWLLNERSVSPVRVAPLSAQPQGNIKYLYSLVREGQRNFYVGGWQPTPVLAFSLPVEHQVIHASVDNPGRDRWSINLAVGEANGISVKKMTDDALEWELSLPLSERFLRCPGYGFWWFEGQGEHVVVVDGATPNFSHTATISSSPRTYIFGGKIFREAISESSNHSAADSTPGTLPNPESVWGNSLSRLKSMQIPVNLSLAGLFSKDEISSKYLNHYSLVGQPFEILVAGASSSDLQISLPWRIDATGSRGVGRRLSRQTSRSFSMTSSSVFADRLTEVEVGRGLWLENRIVEAQADLPLSLYLDLQKQGFTGFSLPPTSPLPTSPLPLFPSLSTAEDLKVEVTFFSAAFQRGKRLKVKTCKPTGEGSQYTFYNASYG